MPKLLSVFIVFYLCLPMVTYSSEEISVVTYNMYVGFDTKDKITRCTAKGDIDFTKIAKEILNEFNSNRPLERIDIAAKELAQRSPDFIALQEAVELKWPLEGAIDFLKTFVEKINAYSGKGGKKYKYISTDNFTQGKTVSICGVDVKAFMTDREAIVYNSEFEVDATSIIRKKLRYFREPIDLDDGTMFIFRRGLLGARFFKKGDGQITLFTTHIDEFVTDEIHDRQVAEILKTISPYLNDPNLVLVGDFDMEENKDSNYDLILSKGFRDTYRVTNPADSGLTCCNLPNLDNQSSVAYQKVDLIFNRSELWVPTVSEIILNGIENTRPTLIDPNFDCEDTFEAPYYTGGTIWVSDHFGVMTIFEPINKIATKNKK